MRYAPALVALMAFGLIFAVAGCGGSSKDAESAIEGLTEKAEDLAESAGEMADEVMEMAPEEMKTKVEEIKVQIAEKEEQLAGLTEKLKGLSPSDLTGDAAAKLKSESETLTTEIEDLKKQLEAAKTP